MSASQIESMFLLMFSLIRMMQVMRISPKQMKKRIDVEIDEIRSQPFKTSRPRREGCVPSRGRAVELADAARLGARPDGSAAGARGARAAGSPAAAPGGQRRPARRLRCVAPALPEVCGTPRHAPARPLRLCHGARRGEGAAMAGEALRLVHQGALCLAAAAVPRLAGTCTVEGWDKTVRSVVLTWSHLNSTPAILLTDCCYTLLGR